jgi:hypothetical protein
VAVWSDQGYPAENRLWHDVGIAERQYVTTVASSAVGIRSAAPATTTTGRMLAFVSPSSLHVISRLRELKLVELAANQYGCVKSMYCKSKFQDIRTKLLRLPGLNSTPSAAFVTLHLHQRHICSKSAALPVPGGESALCQETSLMGNTRDLEA